MARTLIEPNMVLESVVKNFNNKTFLDGNNCYTCTRMVIKELIPDSKLPELTDEDAIKFSHKGFLKEASNRLWEAMYTRLGDSEFNLSGDLGIMHSGSGILCFAVCIEDKVWAAKSDYGFIILDNKSKVRSYRW